MKQVLLRYTWYYLLSSTMSRTKAANEKYIPGMYRAWDCNRC